MTLKSILVAAGLGLAAVAAPTAASAEAPVYTSTFSNVAVSGYDTVSYFTAGKPVKGAANFKVNYKGAEWHFANAANLAKFKASPARYAPQYGGYCAWAVSQGYTASGDPTVWKIVNSKLYLNYNQEIGVKWSKNIPAYIKSGDANWPKVLAS